MHRPDLLPFTASLLIALASLSASAQTVAPEVTDPPEAAASAPAKPKPAPRVLSPTESRDKTSTPGQLRPERPVTPQIAIPMRRDATGALQADAPRPLRPVKPALSGTVDDAAARCNAEADNQARAKCRDALPPRDAERAPG